VRETDLARREALLRDGAGSVHDLGGGGLHGEARAGRVLEAMSVEDRHRPVVAETHAGVVGPEAEVSDHVAQALAERGAVHRDEADQTVVARAVPLGLEREGLRSRRRPHRGVPQPVELLDRYARVAVGGRARVEPGLGDERRRVEPDRLDRPDQFSNGTGRDRRHAASVSPHG
jgi:hypothetical protein